VLEPLSVDGHSRGPRLARRTAGLLEAGEPVVWWKVRRQGRGAAHQAAALMPEHYIRTGPQHYLGRPWTLWSWRSSPDTPALGAMWTGD
jgi:hypothetical protein